MSVSLRLATATTSSACGTGPVRRGRYTSTTSICFSMWNEKLRPSPTWPNPLACTPVVMSAIANSWLPKSLSAARVMTEPYRRRCHGAWETWPFVDGGLAYTCFSIEIHIRTIRELPLAAPPKRLNSANSRRCCCAGNGRTGRLLGEQCRQPTADNRAGAGRAVSSGHRRTRRGGAAVARPRPGGGVRPGNGDAGGAQPGYRGPIDGQRGAVFG